MITDEQYEIAQKQVKENQEIINKYHDEKEEVFHERLKSGKPFTDDELRYASANRCVCGSGMAYPLGCGPNHYWDCSAILKGEAKTTDIHTDQLPFSMWSIKSEAQPSANGATTRPD